MPFFDQSVARQVGLGLSKMRTPSSISLMITDLDSLKIWFSLSVHLKGVPGWRSWWNGSMRLVAAKAYKTWLISPNHEWMSVMLAGVGKWWIASRYFSAWSHIAGRDFKSCKQDGVSPEHELVGVKYNPVVSAKVEPIDRLEEALVKVIYPKEDVVNTFCFVGDVGDNLVELL